MIEKRTNWYTTDTVARQAARLLMSPLYVFISLQLG